jgi:histone H3/H4
MMLSNPGIPDKEKAYKERSRARANKKNQEALTDFIVRVDGQAETFKSVAARLTIEQKDWILLRRRINKLRKQGIPLTTELLKERQ